MHLLILIATIFTMVHQYKCFSIQHTTDDAEGDVSTIPLPINNDHSRSKLLDSRFVSIVNINPFNEQNRQDTETQNLVEQLTKGLEELRISVRSIVDQIKKTEDLLPHCPSNVPSGAKVLGSLCYWIITTPLSLHKAHVQCVGEGGTLAEPLPNFVNPFFSSLKKAFPTEFNNIGTRSLWLGADNYNDLLDIKNRLGSVFLYLTTNMPVPYQTVKPTDKSKQYGATLTSKGLWGSNAATDLNPSICQSSTLHKA